MLLVRRLSKTNNWPYDTYRILVMIWRLIRGKATIFEVYDKNYTSMATLEKNMKDFSEIYDKESEYSLIEDRPFLKVKISTNVKVEQTDKEKLKQKQLKFRLEQKEDDCYVERN